ncbi:MAG: phospholipase D-like domain-containing protein [Zoogloeaceae bacterium]|nr:phospholipase D-like domain-containing protein [Zoogloeaceae bacterium]
MDVMTAREAAQKWNVTQRRVATLCSENRIDGAELIGNMWLIPKSAQKPEDGRVTRFDPPTDMAVKPFLKWAGGKSQILGNKKQSQTGGSKMTEVIINTPEAFYPRFMSLCAKSQRGIKLCAPYVKSNVMAELLKNKRPDASIDLITKVNWNDYRSGVSDLESLEKTLAHNGRVFNWSSLHAKIYIFDDRQCIITSANLTWSGLNKNAECGLLTDDADIVNSVLNFYNGMITHEDIGKITKQEVKDLADFLKQIPPKPPSDNLSAISNSLSGWKRDVFLSLAQFGESFTTAEVKAMAEQLRSKHPRNNNREAKIRQTLQYLRDLGLIEFTSPGIYKKLWHN